MTSKRKIAGVDVGKANLDSLVSGQKEVRRNQNNQAGIKALVASLVSQEVSLVVMEASGGYEKALAIAVVEAGLKVHVANPTRIRSYAKAKGVLAKSDNIDTAVIFDYGEVMQPEGKEIARQNHLKLSELVRRRRQLLAHRMEGKSRIDKQPPATGRSSPREKPYPAAVGVSPYRLL